MHIPTLKDITDELDTLVAKLAGGVGQSSILSVTERYLLFRNLQRVMSSPEVEEALTQINTRLLKGLQKTGGVRAEGGRSDPAMDMGAGPEPIHPAALAAARAEASGGAVVAAKSEPPESVLVVAVGPGDKAVAGPGAVSKPVTTMFPGAAQTCDPPALDAAAFSVPRTVDVGLTPAGGGPSQRTCVELAASGAAPVVPPVADAPKKRGRGRPTKAQAQAALSNGAAVQFNEANIHEHPLYKEMVQGWKPADLAAEYAKVIGGLPPFSNMTTGQIAAAILLGRVSVERTIEIAEDGEQQMLPLDAGQAKKQTPSGAEAEKPSNAEVAKTLQEDVDRLDAEAKGSAPPKKFPDDPMPDHVNAHKVWFGDLQVWECDKCKAEDLIMCIPSLPLDGQLYCSTKCGKCGDAQRFPISEADANEVRKVAKVLISRPPGLPDAAPQPKLKKKTAAPPVLPSQAAAPGVVQCERTGAAAGSIPAPTAGACTASPQESAAVPSKPSRVTAIADPGQLLSEVLGPVAPSPVNTEVMALELAEQIKLWPMEKRITEYEKVAGKAAPKDNLAAFADGEAVRVISEHFAHASAAL